MFGLETSQFLVFLFTPILSSLIGWITNVIAIKLLFRPHEPIQFFKFKLQGMLPKRQSEIAISIGELVEQELINLENIFDDFRKNHDTSTILEIAKDKIGVVVNKKLPILLPSKVKDKILSSINKIIDEEGEDLLDRFGEDGIEEFQKHVSIKKIVEEKINDYEMLEMEELVLDIGKKELKHIENIGAILGFMIGLIQSAVMFFTFIN